MVKIRMKPRMNAGGPVSTDHVALMGGGTIAQLRASGGHARAADRHALTDLHTVPVAFSAGIPEKAEPVAGEREATTLSR